MTTTEKMLKNRDLRNGVLNIVIDELKSWDNASMQSKIELDTIEMIEDTINSNLPEYFDDFQMYFITDKFNSSEDFLNNFYKANPNISIIVNSILQYTVLPIKLILDGKADNTYKPLYYYYGIFNGSLKVLQNLKN